MPWDTIISATVTGLFTIAVVYLAHRLRENTIHINSRMDSLIKKIEEAAFARGKLEEKDEQARERKE